MSLKEELQDHLVYKFDLFDSGEMWVEDVGKHFVSIEYFHYMDKYNRIDESFVWAVINEIKEFVKDKIDLMTILFGDWMYNIEEEQDEIL